MTAATPFFREAGSGPGVVCLHANASSSSQWRALMELLAPHHHVLAPDCHGAGKGPPWPLRSDPPLALRDEVALVEPVLARAGTPLDLVGHSYGAAVALVAALQHPVRVRRLVLYEPTLFALVEADAPRPNDADGIRDAVARAGAALDAGDGDAAAAHFIDYWMGPGAWVATPEARRPAIMAAVAHVRGWAQALISEPTPLAAFAALQMPVLLLQGSDTTASARAVVQRLARTLPQVQLQVLDGLGHMGPVTHPERVNAAIQAFLAA